jgi:hypothetical protein
MQDRLPLQKTFGPAVLRWSWTLVIACGLLLGYYVLRTYASTRDRQYQLDFGKAEWIEPVESFAPIAYFRKEVFFPTLPQKAWIQVAASDTFGLFVNGHTVATEGSVKTYETGIYDIKRALKQGTNVIAVSVSRTSYPGSAQLLLRGKSPSPAARLFNFSPMEAGGSATTPGLFWARKTGFRSKWKKNFGRPRAARC